MATIKLQPQVRKTPIRVVVAAPSLPDLDYTGAYVDARGVHPTLVFGVRAHTLEGCDRHITVADAIGVAVAHGMLE